MGKSEPGPARPGFSRTARYNPGDRRPARSESRVPSQDPARRAVVTAMGAITPIGNDAETYWSNLLAGVSGAGLISTFDTTNHACKIGGG